jgi:hypothetical protein
MSGKQVHVVTVDELGRAERLALDHWNFNLHYPLWLSRRNSHMGDAQRSAVGYNVRVRHVHSMEDS